MDDVTLGVHDRPQVPDGGTGAAPDPNLAAAPHGYNDWRDSPRLPRNGYYRRRNQPVSLLVVHHTASESDDILSDNRYHTQMKDWNEPPNQPGVPFLRAPHIAYHFYIDRSGLLTACNYIWERSWHATDANDKGVGIVCQGDFQGSHRPTDAQLETLQWLLGVLMDFFSLDRTSVWGHGELRQYGNSTTCPGKNFLPAVQAFRTGQDFSSAPAVATAPMRWQVVDANGTSTVRYNLTATAAAAAEMSNGVGIYISEGRIRIDFRGARNANPNPPAKWRLCDPVGTHVGLYNQTSNAVENAERIKGYALYMYDSPDGTVRMDFRDLPA